VAEAAPALEPLREPIDDPVVVPPAEFAIVL
jgi:hypothetical protein